jgi:hypothetical protein
MSIDARTAMAPHRARTVANSSSAHIFLTQRWHHPDGNTRPASLEFAWLFDLALSSIVGAVPLSGYPDVLSFRLNPGCLSFGGHKGR